MVEQSPLKRLVTGSTPVRVTKARLTFLQAKRSGRLEVRIPPPVHHFLAYHNKFFLSLSCR